MGNIKAKTERFPNTNNPMDVAFAYDFEVLIRTAWEDFESPTIGASADIFRGLKFTDDNDVKIREGEISAYLTDAIFLLINKYKEDESIKTDLRLCLRALYGWKNTDDLKGCISSVFDVLDKYNIRYTNPFKTKWG